MDAGSSNGNGNDRSITAQYFTYVAAFVLRA